MIQQSTIPAHNRVDADFDADAALRCAQLGILAVLAALGWLYPLLNVQPEILLGTQCWTIAGLYFWSVWSWYRVTHRLFDWYLIFLSAAYIFNAGHVFLEVLHLNEFGILDGEFSATTVMQTLYLVQLSLAALHWGALEGVGKLSPAAAGSYVMTVTPAETLVSLRLVGCALLLIAAPFAAMLMIEAMQIVLSGGYFALYQQEMPTGLGAGPKVLSTFLIPGVLFLLAASRESRPLRLSAILIVLGYAAINFFLGVRHEAAVLLVAFAWLWDRQVRPLNITWLLAGGAFTVMVVFPLVAATRNVSGSDRISMEFLIDQFTTLENPAVAAVHEMGGSMNTVAHTLELVPSSHDFEWGAGYGYAWLTLFPNLFWDVHPSIARKIPSSWLIWEVDPYTAEQGGGLGYSFLAEAYLNFGWLGLVPVMIVFGYLGGKAVRWGDQHGHAERAALLAAAFSFLVFFVRAELAVVLRGVIWYAAVPYCAVRILTLTQHALGQRSPRLNGRGLSPVVSRIPPSAC